MLYRVNVLEPSKVQKSFTGSSAQKGKQTCRGSRFLLPSFFLHSIVGKEFELLSDADKIKARVGLMAARSLCSLILLHCSQNG